MLMITEKISLNNLKEKIRVSFNEEKFQEKNSENLNCLSVANIQRSGWKK